MKLKIKGKHNNFYETTLICICVDTFFKSKVNILFLVVIETDTVRTCINPLLFTSAVFAEHLENQ